MSTDAPIVHGLTAGNAAVPILVNADGTVNTTSAGSSSNIVFTEQTQAGTFDSNNSSTAPLGISAAFTGTYTDLTPYTTTTVTCKADASGSLYADYSTDGVTTIRTVTLSTRAADMGIHSLIRVARYFRVRLVNNSVAQTSLQLSTLHNYRASIALPTSRAQQVLNEYSDVLNVRLVGDPRLDEASSKQSQRSVIQKFGYNPAVAASTEEVIWSVSTAAYNFLTAAATVRVAAGGNAADTAAGSGARTIRVEGLDSNWDTASEDLTLAGGSASASTSTSFIRVNRAYVLTAGTYTGANTGTITIQTTAGTTLCAIQATRGQSQLGVYTVPDGLIAFIRRIDFYSDSAKVGSALLYQRQNADTVSAPFTGKRLLFQAPLSGNLNETFQSYLGPFPARTDLYMAAIGGTGGMAVSGSMDIVLVASV